MIVLPVEWEVQQLRESLSAMQICDYDINELLSTAVTALEQRQAYGVEIARFAENYLYRVSNPHQPQSDRELLSKAWFQFATALSEIYARHKVWDESGHAPYYYKQQLGNDLVICPFPT